MLAVTTGYTQAQITGDTAELTDSFRRAAHWYLYAERMGRILDDLDRVRGMSSDGMTPKARAELERARIGAARDADAYRELLYPRDDADG